MNTPLLLCIRVASSLSLAKTLLLFPLYICLCTYAKITSWFIQKNEIAESMYFYKFNFIRQRRIVFQSVRINLHTHQAIQHPSYYIEFKYTFCTSWMSFKYTFCTNWIQIHILYYLPNYKCGSTFFFFTFLNHLHFPHLQINGFVFYSVFYETVFFLLIGSFCATCVNYWCSKYIFPWMGEFSLLLKQW